MSVDLAREQSIAKKGMTERPTISFCIATFQRYEVLKELVEEILSVQTDQIEVVVSDDRSLDGSAEKIRKIKDSRLKVFVNEKNVGSSLNIHDSLDRGNGRYLFYVNDRDNVDSFKIETLIKILEELEEKNVALARCYGTYGNAEKYHIFNAGKESMIQFACRIDHPTGYIFKRDIWKKIKNKRVLFENQNYGDYPITQVCAIMAKRYKGALIYGDICDLQRRRVDFLKEKSGYYKNRKDKRLWYTPEVMFRELQICEKFLKKIDAQEDIREQIVKDRYTEYLSWCVTGYRDKIADPVCTAHYNFYPKQDFFHVFTGSVQNGIKLWNKIFFLCLKENRRLIPQIRKASQREYEHYFRGVLRDDLHISGRMEKKIEEKDCEIVKREAVLNTYEKWVEMLIKNKMISTYLSSHGYHHAAIYGMGRIGKHLWKEFHSSDVSIDFVIDKKISEQAEYYGDVRCFAPESEFPCTDIIIVTVPGEAGQVINQLRKKVRCPVKSIDDILFVLQ